MKQLVYMLFFIISACATTSVTSFKDPTSNDIRLQKVVVVASISDLSDRELVESSMSAKINQSGLACVKSIDLFMPTREYTFEEMSKILKEHEIDGTLIITIADIQQKEKTYSRTRPQLNTMSGNWENSTSVYSKTSTTLSFGVELYRIEITCAQADSNCDMSNRVLVWTASARSQELYNPTIFETPISSMLINSFAKNVAAKLKEDGIVRR